MTTIDLSTIKPVPMSRLTLGEIGTFERRTGISFSSMGDDDVPMAVAMAGIAGLVIHRSHPEWSIAECFEAADTLTLEEASRIIEGGMSGTGAHAATAASNVAALADADVSIPAPEAAPAPSAASPASSHSGFIITQDPTGPGPLPMA